MTPQVYAQVIAIAKATPLRFDPPLDSPEYKASMAKLPGTPANPPREDWPVDITEQIQRHRELSMLAIKEAARHARSAIELANQDAPCAS